MFPDVQVEAPKVLVRRPLSIHESESSENEATLPTIERKRRFSIDPVLAGGRRRHSNAAISLGVRSKRSPDYTHSSIENPRISPRRSSIIDSVGVNLRKSPNLGVGARSRGRRASIAAHGLPPFLSLEKKNPVSSNLASISEKSHFRVVPSLIRLSERALLKLTRDVMILNTSRMRQNITQETLLQLVAYVRKFGGYDESFIRRMTILGLRTFDLSHQDQLGDTCLEPMINNFTREINLSHCASITAEGINSLSNCSKLLSVSLRGTSKDNISYLSGLPCTLTSLDLSNQPCLSDQNISHLTSLCSLQVLKLSGCLMLTDDCVAETLIFMDKLISLDLSWCARITTKASRDLSFISSLKTLNLGFSGVTAVSLQDLCVLSNMEDLNLTMVVMSQVPETQTKQLCSMTRLQSLSLTKGSTTDTAIELMSPLHQLTKLELNSTKVSCRVVQILSKYFLDLTCLNLSDNWLGGKDVTCLKHFADLPRLRELHLEACGITDKTVPILRSLTTLEVLMIRSNQISSSVIGFVTDLPRLSSLSAGVSDKSIRSIVSVNLRSLVLEPSRSKTKGKQKAPKTTKTKRSRLTAAGLSVLPEFSRLSQLSLVQVDITENILNQLRLCSRLDQLKLIQCLILNDNALRFYAAFCNVTVQRSETVYRKRRILPSLKAISRWRQAAATASAAEKLIQIRKAQKALAVEKAIADQRMDEDEKEKQDADAQHHQLLIDGLDDGSNYGIVRSFSYGGLTKTREVEVSLRRCISDEHIRLSNRATKNITIGMEDNDDDDEAMIVVNSTDRKRPQLGHHVASKMISSTILEQKQPRLRAQRGKIHRGIPGKEKRVPALTSKLMSIILSQEARDEMHETMDWLLRKRAEISSKHEMKKFEEATGQKKSLADRIMDEELATIEDRLDDFEDEIGRSKQVRKSLEIVVDNLDSDSNVEVVPMANEYSEKIQISKKAPLSSNLLAPSTRALLLKSKSNTLGDVFKRGPQTGRTKPTTFSAFPRTRSMVHLFKEKMKPQELVSNTHIIKIFPHVPSIARYEQSLTPSMGNLMAHEHDRIDTNSGKHGTMHRELRVRSPVLPSDFDFSDTIGTAVDVSEIWNTKMGTEQKKISHMKDTLTGLQEDNENDEPNLSPTLEIHDQPLDLDTSPIAWRNQDSDTPALMASESPRLVLPTSSSSHFAPITGSAGLADNHNVDEMRVTRSSNMLKDSVEKVQQLLMSTGKMKPRAEWEAPNPQMFSDSQTKNGIKQCVVLGMPLIDMASAAAELLDFSGIDEAIVTPSAQPRVDSSFSSDIVMTGDSYKMEGNSIDLKDSNDSLSLKISDSRLSPVTNLDQRISPQSATKQSVTVVVSPKGFEWNRTDAIPSIPPLENLVKNYRYDRDTQAKSGPTSARSSSENYELPSMIFGSDSSTSPNRENADHSFDLTDLRLSRPSNHYHTGRVPLRSNKGVERSELRADTTLPGLTFMKEDSGTTTVKPTNTDNYQAQREATGYVQKTTIPIDLEVKRFEPNAGYVASQLYIQNHIMMNRAQTPRRKILVPANTRMTGRPREMVELDGPVAETPRGGWMVERTVRVRPNRRPNPLPPVASSVEQSENTEMKKLNIPGANIPPSTKPHPIVSRKYVYDGEDHHKYSSPRLPPERAAGQFAKHTRPGTDQTLKSGPRITAKAAALKALNAWEDYVISFSGTGGLDSPRVRLPALSLKKESTRLRKRDEVLY